MDFVENYICQFLEEIQFVYWNVLMVIFYFVVVYYYLEDSSLFYKSRVFVFDELGYNFAIVYVFFKELIFNLKVMFFNLKYVYYYIDSFIFQYRNKIIFCFISYYKEFFDVIVLWNYFEVGYGKGFCDGVGGFVKRMVDEVVR